MTEPHTTTEAQLATQSTLEPVDAPLSAAHESHAEKKHEAEEELSGHPPHKRYRAEPHHTILLANRKTSNDPVLSPTEYIADFLKSHSALSVIPEEERGKIITLNASHSAGEAMSLLAKGDVLSSPVYDKELEAYVGFVDYLDLASLIVDIVHGLMKEWYSDTPLADLDDHQQSRIVHEAKRKFNTKTIFDISDLSHSDPFMPILKGATLYQAIEILAKFGIHRVPITNDEQKIEAILSQSSVVKFLFKNLDKFAPKAKKTVADLLANREESTVLTILETAPAFEAFELMLKHRVSAVGVVNESGSLVGVLSGTDLKIIGPHANTLSLLLHPAKQLMEQSRELNSVLLVPVVKVTKTDTLGIAIENMEDNNVHRVFVVDDEGKPLCVLSMKDVLAEFLTV